MSIKRNKPLFSLADQLFNKDSVAKLCKAMETSCEGFNSRRYQKRVLNQFPDLELKARVTCMVDELVPYLPDSYEATLDVLQKSLPEPLDPGLKDDDFGEFIWSVPSEYVAQYGCQKDRLDASLKFLKLATKRFTVEGPIRPFLAEFPKQTMKFIQGCATDKNYHVRRLASEGIRPYLPWAQKVVLPAPDVVKILDRLHADSTRYVTRSVANNLNDLSRDHPELVLETLSRWQEQGKQNQTELDWITNHALRTLVKSDDARALELLGYPSKPKFKLTDVRCEESISVGNDLHWQARLTASQNQRLKIFLRVHFLRSDGNHSTKSFAVCDKQLQKGEQLSIEKKIGFKPLSTRTLYPGVQHIELVVNGVTRGKRSFELKA